MKTLQTCGKCGGSGHLAGFIHIDDGVCYPCKGSGTYYAEEEVERLSCSRQTVQAYVKTGNGVTCVATFYHEYTACKDMRFEDIIGAEGTTCKVSAHVITINASTKEVTHNRCFDGESVEYATKAIKCLESKQYDYLCSLDRHDLLNSFDWFDYDIWQQHGKIVPSLV